MEYLQGRCVFLRETRYVVFRVELPMVLVAFSVS